MIDFEKLGEEIATLVHDSVKAATDPLTDRIAQIEELQPAPAIKGDPGETGKPGKDGESVTVAEVADAVAANFERRFADLSISWERQARDLAEKAIDRMPSPAAGKDGTDGRDFAQPEFDYDGRRGLIVRSLVDGVMTEQSFRLPLVMDAGFYAEGKDYEPGDGVTFGGSYWIAQKDTDSKPEIGNPDWRLAVKKGRDGKK